MEEIVVGTGESGRTMKHHLNGDFHNYGLCVSEAVQFENIDLKLMPIEMEHKPSSTS